MNTKAYAIKTEITDPSAETFDFSAQKTMYGGKHIAQGDTIFLFASENEGGPGLIAIGVVTSAHPLAKKPGIERQTPRLSLAPQLQILSPSHEQNSRPLGNRGGVTPWILLIREIPQK